MGHSKTYANLDNRREVAVNDIREYVGDERFNRLDALLREAVRTGEISSQRQFSMTLFLFPVSGYPLEAWYETICADVGVAITE